MGREYQPGESISASHKAPASTITIAVTAVATRSQRVGISGRLARQAAPYFSRLYLGGEAAPKGLIKPELPGRFRGGRSLAARS